jgi:glycosyltransferase involved in cell wall biosynthesis
MKLLFVTPTYPPMPGGGERYAAALAAQLRDRGHTVAVITSLAAREADLWDGSGADRMPTVDGDIRRLPVRPFPGGRSGLMAYRKAMVLLSAVPGDQSGPLLRLARRVPIIDGLDEALAVAPEIDLIHAFNLSWESTMAGAARLAEARGCPLVVTPFAHFGVGADDRVARNSTMDHQRRLMAGAAGVMVLTEVEKAGLSAIGVAPERITVLGGGADALPAGWEQAAATPEARAWPQPYALFIGRAGRDKGAIDAAEAILALRRGGRDVSLLLAGSLSPDFVRWHQRLPAADRVAIATLGIVPEETKHALLSRAAMLLLPSRSDSFGIVLLEAWQHGVPVIGARAGGIPGVIDDGRDGLLVDYGDVGGLAAAIGHLLDSPAWAAELGADGRRKVTTDLTWDQAATRAGAAYGRILGRS